MPALHETSLATTDATPILTSHATPTSTLPDTVTSPKSKGRGKTEEDLDETEDQARERIEAAKAASIAAGTETFDCEWVGPKGGCRTGQVNLKKDSRTCVSDYFGRNKSMTKNIKRQVRWCRKHYQRHAYNVPQWQTIRLSLVRLQLGRIEEDDPGTKYDIALKRSELKRLSDFNNTRGKKGHKPFDELKKGESPIPVLQHLFNNFMGIDKSLAHCMTLVQYCEDEFLAGNIKTLPSFEMVPKIATVGDAEDSMDEESDSLENGTDASPSPTPAARYGSSNTPKGKFKSPANRDNSPRKKGTPGSHLSRNGGIKKP